MLDASPRSEVILGSAAGMKIGEFEVTAANIGIGGAFAQIAALSLTFRMIEMLFVAHINYHHSQAAA